MPLLKEEPSIFPANLLTERPSYILSIEQAQRQWHILRTKPRHEKALARVLYKSEIPFYLPLVTRRHLHSRASTCCYAPLLPGYLFLYGRDEERLAALQTKRVVVTLPHVDQDQLWSELRGLQQLIASGLAVTLEQRLHKGQRVRVRHGALAGLEGTITAMRGQLRLIVALPVLQQVVSVEMEARALEAA